jgi:hypothetical protein
MINIRDNSCRNSNMYLKILLLLLIHNWNSIYIYTTPQNARLIQNTKNCKGVLFGYWLVFTNRDNIKGSIL